MTALYWFFQGLLALAVFMIISGVLVRSRKRPDCKTCAYNVDGGCRRYPPSRVYTGQKTAETPLALDVTVFPVVMNADGWWCGEYRRRS